MGHMISPLESIPRRPRVPALSTMDQEQRSQGAAPFICPLALDRDPVECIYEGMLRGKRSSLPGISAVSVMFGFVRLKGV